MESPESFHPWLDNPCPRIDIAQDAEIVVRGTDNPLHRHDHVRQQGADVVVGRPHRHASCSSTTHSGVASTVP